MQRVFDKDEFFLTNLYLVSTRFFFFANRIILEQDQGMYHTLLKKMLLESLLNAVLDGGPAVPKLTIHLPWLSIFTKGTSTFWF